MSLPDLRGLLEALHAAGVDFVVIGAVALVAHRRVRTTEDLDIVPDPTPENREKLVTVLVRRHARLALEPGRALGERERRALVLGRNLSVTTDLGDLDVVQLLPGVPGYGELAARATSIDFGGVPVRVCSLEHLIAMKRARGSRQDLADLELLEGG